MSRPGYRSTSCHVQVIGPLHVTPRSHMRLMSRPGYRSTSCHVQVIGPFHVTSRFQVHFMLLPYRRCTPCHDQVSNARHVRSRTDLIIMHLMSRPGFVVPQIIPSSFPGFKCTLLHAQYTDAFCVTTNA
ncbi:hypothetical protein RRG08_064590 [Elysia crispata]|uniref:Uncharacterized protein n=1 Tax=Elysia crispata TaxID=231223 RepID=A0AAE1BAU7_9GAST|nr:hypothetical protein RRG08_064590 [Elysia crispata]